MKISAESLITTFFRTYLDIFTPKEFQKILTHVGVKCSVEECRDFLTDADNVFYLDENHFQTKAGAFTGCYFSFRPARREVDKGVFIPGHRCLPFVDSDFLSCGLKFIYKGETLPQKVEKFGSDFVLPYFSLYGDEFALQYIAADPANSGKMNLADMDFSLPSEISLTAISLEPLIKDGFRSGDRILCRLIDWDAGKIEVEIDKHDENPFQITKSDLDRNMWYENLEQYFLDSLEFLGPRGSIEEQVSWIFFTGLEIFCGRDCGSMEEFLAWSQKIGIQSFGVESRLWRKGEDVPAIGGWNSPLIDEDAPMKRFGKLQPLVPLTECVCVCFLKDMIYNKDTDFDALMKKMYPHQEYYSDEQKKCMLLHLKTRHDILSKDYNRFADSEISDIRHQTLELYAVVNELVSLIDIEGKDLKNLPQQALVILSQIYGHLTHLLEMMEDETQTVIDEMEEIELSLEGMDFNFECVSEELQAAISRENKSGFTIIKK